MLNQFITFGPFHLDPRSGLAYGKRAVRLTPKALALLCFLAGNRDRVVSKDELFDALWSGAAVGDAALVSCIQELRKALHDDARRPRFIETLHRRGYRFIGELSADQRRSAVSASSPVAATSGQLVGRDGEFAHLEAALAAACGGSRQMMMVTGDAGIGKTTMVRTFLARAAQATGVRITWGQAAEHYGASEPYYLILDALARACRAPWGEDFLLALERHAPLWLAQIPSLLGPARLRALQQRTAGATRERMQRELTAALEAAVTSSTLVLWLEDLHWADVSTIDWLAAFMRRPEPASVLIIGTYRTGEASEDGDPVRAMRDELWRQGQCRELALGPLQSGAVIDYVVARYPAPADNAGSLSQLAVAVHTRTGGSPLFMVGVLNELEARGDLACEHGAWSVRALIRSDAMSIPQDVSQAIDRQIDRLDPVAARLLEIASVAGAEFSAAAVAVASDRPLDEVDRQCHDLARHHLFLRAEGAEAWHDGTIASRFVFVHALYREALYERLPAGRRVALHRSIGERLAQGYGDRADEIAAQLAMHFERGCDAARAIAFLQRAGETAVRRHASIEAVAHFERALDLLPTLPPTRSRDELEVSLRLALSAPLIAIHGFGSTVVEACATKAQALGDALGDHDSRFAAHRLIWNHSLMRHPVPATLSHAEALMVEADRSEEPAKRALAHRALGCSLIYAGRLEEADRVLERGIELADRTPDATFTPYGEDPGIICRVFGAWAKALMGRPDQAAHLAESGVAHARDRNEPHALAFALVTVGLAYLFQSDIERADAASSEVLILMRQNKLPQWEAFAQEIQGWVICRRGDPSAGRALIAGSLERLRATGARTHSSRILANLAESCLAGGDVESASVHLDAAFAHRANHGEHYFAPELYRLRALVLERRGAPFDAIEAALAEALTTAKRFDASLFADRAARTLALRRAAVADATGSVAAPRAGFSRADTPRKSSE